MQGIYSDATRLYREPLEPKINDVVKVRIRVKSGLNPNFIFVLKKEGQNSIRLKMEYEFSNAGFDYYYQRFIARSGNIKYYFEFSMDGKTYYVNSIGISENLNEYYSFYINPGFSTPDWAKGIVMYQIFVDRFNNGDKNNDVIDGEYEYIGHEVKTVDWNAPIEKFDVNIFHGGDLQGIIDKIDYFVDLGVEAIYINPIFVSPSNHKYDIQDYFNVDPHYGKIINDDSTYKGRVTDEENLNASNELFAEFVSKFHKKGIKIIIDGVFNHCGSFNKWMDSYGIYGTNTLTDKNAKYRKYFNFDESNNYESWWGNETLPKLNYEASERLRDDIYSVARKWISPPYNVDGWRLDVAADLGSCEDFNHEFWREFRKNVKGVNKDCYIVAEHYGNPISWLSNGEWDTVMNYDAFMEPFTWFLTGMEKHSDEYRHDLYNNADAFWGAMKHYSSLMPIQSYMCAMNQLSNHDHSRFLTRTNKIVGRINTVGADKADVNLDKRVLMIATVMQMTWRGCPTLYYGDEVGLSGFTDPDNRRPYPWGREDKNLYNFFKDIIAFRKKYKDTLTYSSIIELYRGYGIICYARVDLNNAIIVAVNNSDNYVQFDIPIWLCGKAKNDEMKEEFQTSKFRHGKWNRSYHSIKKDYWSIRLAEKSSRVFTMEL